MKAIGELLVALGLTTRDQVREALENQAIFGGRIGTNLLELGAVTEEGLAEALGRRFGVPFRSGPLDVAREALALLRPEVAARLEAVPSAVSGRTLEVLVANPSDLARLDEVAFATGKQVRPVVVPEARLWELLHRHYGIERVLRGLGVPQRSEQHGAGDGTDELLQDLMGEEAFTALYVARDGARPIAGGAPTPPNGAPAGAGRVLPAPGRLAPSAGGHSSAPRWTPPPAPVAPEPPADAPLDGAEALAALAATCTRDEVAGVLLRAAAAWLRRAVLLDVQGEHAVGRRAVGEGVDPARIGALRLRLRDTGIVGTVVRTRAHVLGPLLCTEQNLQLLRALGAGIPPNGMGIPVLVHGRVGQVLYGDAGVDALVDAGAVGDLLIVAARASVRYEELAAR